ncbi:hypothetical protein F2Q70_00040203 [Brassica cretica]|uniref:DDT domain-containing protein n=1 Tax=Brassica cretica TaxID=69181 RepID=A0A8S9K9S4_BRACR|nr:hypothetical protein F2Q70_00040203 [Brassica cretica]
MGSSSDVVPDHHPPADDTSPVTDTKPPTEETTPLRRTRPSRACTLRTQQRLREQQAAERKLKQPKKECKRKKEVEEADDQEEEEEDDDESQMQCVGGSSGRSKIVTSLVSPPEASQMPRWNLRSMWELASVLNFLHAIPPVTRMALTRDTWVTVLCRKIRDCWHWVAEGDLPIVASQGRETEVYKSFDPAIRVVILKALCDIRAEQEDIRSYIDNSLKTGVHLSAFRKDRVGGDSHGAIPPVTRMALTRDTWVTVLCRKIRDCWHWVAEGDLPIVASQGRETEVYKSFDPAIRVVILKALCDIRAEQEDIRSYIDNSLKTGVHLSAFRKDRVGGDSHGVNFWYEDDPLVGHRLYREIRKAEVVKAKTKGSKILPNITYQWEAVATNFDEFQDVSEKLNSSSSRIEVSLGKKLTRDMLPEIEKEHKRKEKLLKKQHRQALLLDNCLVVDGHGAGRSLRDRKPVRYTFDDYDQSINEAIKITKYALINSRNEIWLLDSDVIVMASEKLNSSSSRIEVSLGKKLTRDMLPEIEKEHKRKEKLLKKQHRQALLLDNCLVVDGHGAGRSLRDRKPVRYTFDDYDQSINEAIKITKMKHPSPESLLHRRESARLDALENGRSTSSTHPTEPVNDTAYAKSSDSADYDEFDEQRDERRQRSQRYSATDFVETVSDNDVEFESDDDIVGEAVYDEEYMRKRLRRSKRATRIDYKQYELSESDKEATGAAKRKRLVEPDEHSDETGNGDFTRESEDSEENANDPETKSSEEEKPREVNDYAETTNGTENNQLSKSNGTGQEEAEGVVGKRRFLDLNELAPVSGFDDGPSTVLKEDDKGDNS